MTLDEYEELSKRNALFVEGLFQAKRERDRLREALEYIANCKSNSHCTYCRSRAIGVLSPTILKAKGQE